MSLRVTLPGLRKPKNVKDAVILILSKEWPMRSVTIHGKIRKEYKLKVSPQAVHKALNLLVAEGVIKKNYKSYFLNKEWIEKVKKFVKKLG